ncbi:MAG TPA: helix-turn-helix domain-containing protein [Gemmataceae bacterium]|nr:helix-turn-helix domain-containing protein [Gemmataceae bacterium]
MSRFLLTREVAELLRMSEDGVRELVAEGRLKARRVRPKGQLLFDPADVEQALREARPEPAAAR